MLDLKKFQKMSRDLASGYDDVKAELETKVVEGVAGGGAIRVTMNGNQEVTSVKISAEAVDPDDIQMLEDLVRAAVNQANENARELQRTSMQHLTGGMNIPGMPFL